MAERQRHFAVLGYRLISQVKPLIPMSVNPKITGANYSQRWGEMSAHWVALHGCPQTVGCVWRQHGTLLRALLMAIKKWVSVWPERLPTFWLSSHSPRNLNSEKRFLARSFRFLK
jgi:hypothetical protein